MEPERRLAAVLSADVVGYSRLMAANESATIEAIAQHREQVAILVRKRRGRVVDFVGDNVLAEFATATEAVACAAEIQGVLQVLNERLGDDERMDFRIGVHLGEIRAEGGSIYGSGVNIAARLESLAEPGGICISSGVHEQVRGEPGFAFDDLGAKELKNIPHPVQAFRVRREAERRDEPCIEARPGTSGGASVAVLPFVNMSPDPDQEYFADGMAEELINALAQIDGLRVIARTSAFSFKGQSADIQTIGAKLGVAAVVEGSVRKAGDRLRITAQLIDVAGGHHLWSESYDRSIDDVFQIQDEIVRTIVATIKPKLLPDAEAPLVTRATASAEAYELYLRASERLAKVERWETRTAIEMLKDATALDPAFADAWGRLGVACCQMNAHFDDDRRWHNEGSQAAARAFALDPENAEAHYAHGRFLWTPAGGFENRLALRALDRALARQPGTPEYRTAHALILFHIGLYDQAKEGLLEALDAQPDDAFTLLALTQQQFFGGDRDKALEYGERCTALHPHNVLRMVFFPSFKLYQGELAGAEREIDKARTSTSKIDDPILDSLEALLWAKRGEPQRAEAALARALEDRPSLTHTHHTWHFAAATLALLGRPGEAVEQLRAASGCGLPNYPLFRDDPHLTALHREPEMQVFMTEIEGRWRGYRDEFGDR